MHEGGWVYPNGVFYYCKPTALSRFAVVAIESVASN
jgi:hypothetical protein